MIRLTGLLLSLLLSAHLLSAETILVLPFFNLSKSKNIDWVGDSISETIVESLAAEGLSVVRPEYRDEILRQMSVKRYALLTQASVMEIAVNSDAATVIFGDFDFTPAAPGSPSKGTLRLASRILNVRHVHRGKPASLTGPIEDLSALQTALAWQNLTALSGAAALTEDEFRRSHPSIRIDALESYVRGLRSSSPEQKHKLFANAVRLEPGYSQPCFQLGRLNFNAHNYRTAADWYQRVAPGDLHYREALFFLGLSRYYTGDFKTAADSLGKVAAVVPLAEVLNNLGAALLRAGDPAAVDSFQKALEIDPADPVYHFNAGYALWRRGDFTTAADRFRAALERDPADETATLLLGRCLKRQGPRPGDLRTESQERLKTEYNESAWLSLKAMLAPKPQQ